ncbi:MAG TPA: YigZ family protein [Trueperaceae bacterium]|nr:YigZ family protein [Trueperaceae bacterium]
MGYFTVAKEYEHFEEVKKSKFYAYVCRMDDLELFKIKLAQIKAKYPDAGHHCFAYKLGSEIRFSDDGEPGGTAGRPMFELIDKRNLDHILAINSRYFGGTKLGTGGLARAYSGSLAKAIDQAGIIEIKDRLKLRFEVPFSEMDGVHRLLDDWAELKKENIDYSANGLIIEVSLLANDLENLKTKLANLTRGKVIL